MTILLRIAVWAIATGFYADVLRRCWIVEAWTIAPLAFVALLFSAWHLRKAWRAARRNKSTGFVRIRT